MRSYLSVIPRRLRVDDSEQERHWRRVYETKAADEVSWFQASPAPSLDMISKAGLAPGARIVDVGGGASTLIDHLLDQGFQVTGLDIADSALDVARARLGDRSARATWIATDVTTWRPEAQFDLWHDRAVFHFLTDPGRRAQYIAALRAALAPSGWVVMATFGPEGPEKCSGLPVRRWSAQGLAAELGDDFRLVEAADETHLTPGGSGQVFTWALLQSL